ncbi:chromatin associated protein KTI12 [Corynascus novoguineensis]|uniref:Chromatin associated protein KTI12 n=1 Tax=Corynascus novoguineensis TaxID=1126955 RepID=A0AAN7CZ45_9PEZI|nr:chromatin associated protein KTI12 [Corynascus novoguineensis]
MPLIIVTGLPTSGKTTRARQLYDYLSARLGTQQAQQQQQQQQTPSPSPNPNSNPKPPYRLHFISDSTLSISRTVYDLSPAALPAHVRSANASEKDARAAVYGAVKRVLSPRDIVVLDGLNYIKGWRYQLYCEAKNVRTPSCVLQIGAGVERARAVNEARLSARGKRAREEKEDGPSRVSKEEDGKNENAPQQQEQQQTQPQKIEEGASSHSQKANDHSGDDRDNIDDDEEPYEPSNWENLVFRYEEPNPMTRWDSPLFTLIWEDDEAQTRAVFDKIWDAVAGEGRKVVKPNQSAVQRDKDPGGDYLYVLERETQDIVKRILERQPDEGGGEVTLPRVNNNPAGSGEGSDLVVELPGKKVGLPQLQRYRRAFVALNRGGIGLEAVGKLAAERLRESFVGYLNDAFEKDG